MSLSIDCSTCVRQETDSCGDCLVSFITSREPDDAIVIDVAEFAAIRRLQAAGMIPDLQHQSAGGA